MKFGTKLKILRISKDLDQNDMSKLLLVSQPVYSRYENNEKKVKKDDAFVKRVSEEFKVSQKWLTSEEDNNISIVFEKDSINTGSTGVIGQIENYYVVPKDF